MMTNEEKKEVMEKIQEMQKKAFALTTEERMHICDMGFYNDVIKGYLIEAMRNAGFEHKDIERALDGLRVAFDDTTATEAADSWHKFS